MCHMGIESCRELFKFLSFLAIFALISREIFQLIVLTASGICYFKSFINFFEILLIILAILSQTLTDSNDLRVARAFTIIFAAFELLHLLGELPFLSISTNMVILRKVVKSYLKSMILYVTLPVAFALAFLVLHGKVVDQIANTPDTIDPTAQPSEEVDEFSNFGFPMIAMLKVLVMGVGEFDAQALELHLKSTFYWIIFILFVILIPIVLFNVLAALAFDDIHKIKAEGELTDLRARIKVLARYEKIMKSNLLSNMRKSVAISSVLSDGKVVVSPSRKFAIVNDKIIESDGCFGDLVVKKDRDCVFSCNRLDAKIGKKLRAIIEERKVRKIQKESENEVKNELQAIREEMKSLKIDLKMLCGVIMDRK